MKTAVLLGNTPHEAEHEALPLRPELGRGSVVLACLGGVMLMAMMLLTICDVIGRYLFSAPITGAAELTEIFLCATIFLGLGAVSVAEEHVTVDLFTDKFPIAFQPYRLALIGVFCGLVLAMVSWRIWVYAAQIGGYGGTTSSLAIPIAPLGYFCAICTAIGGMITVFLPLKRLVTHVKN